MKIFKNLLLLFIIFSIFISCDQSKGSSSFSKRITSVIMVDSDADAEDEPTTLILDYNDNDISSITMNTDSDSYTKVLLGFNSSDNLTSMLVQSDSDDDEETTYLYQDSKVLTKKHFSNNVETESYGYTYSDSLLVSIVGNIGNIVINSNFTYSNRVLTEIIEVITEPVNADINNKTSLIYNDSGIVTQKLDYSKDGFGNYILKRKTSYEYDSDGKLTKRILDDISYHELTHSTFEYDSDGYLSIITAAYDIDGDFSFTNKYTFTYEEGECHSGITDYLEYDTNIKDEKNSFAFAVMRICGDL